MEVIIQIVSLLLLAGLVFAPLLILRFLNKSNVKFKFLTYLVVALITTALLMFSFAWWAHTTDKILLGHFGYDINGMSESERYNGVSLDNNNRVKQLETSIMGIGWPLKAILTFAYYIPYLLVVYGLGYVMRKWTQRPKPTANTGQLRQPDITS